MSFPRPLPSHFSSHAPLCPLVRAITSSQNALQNKIRSKIFPKKFSGVSCECLPHTLCGFEKNPTSDYTRRRTHNHWFREQVSNHSCYVLMSLVVRFFYSIKYVLPWANFKKLKKCLFLVSYPCRNLRSSCRLVSCRKYTGKAIEPRFCPSFNARIAFSPTGL